MALYSAVGKATVSGFLQESVWSAVGRATVSGTLTAGEYIVELAGLTEGSGTVTAELPGWFLGEPGGSATGSAGLHLTHNLVSEPAGAGGFTGTLIGKIPRGLQAEDAWYRSSDTWIEYQPETNVAFLMRVNYQPGGPRGASKVGSLMVVPSSGAAAGIGLVAGNLSAGPRGIIDGTGTVTGWLEVATESGSAGTGTVTGTLDHVHELMGNPAGQSTIVAEVALNNMFAASGGAGAVQGVLNLAGAGFEAGFEIPYPFLGGGNRIDEIFDTIYAGSTAGGDLTVIRELIVGSDGTTTVADSTLTLTGTPALDADQVDGVATVTGWLLNRVDANVVELAGGSAGIATVTGSGFLTVTPADPVAQSRFLYLYCNVGVSFDPTDDDSGDARYVSQTFEDGDVKDFNRYLYLLANLGVSFDPTDDDSGDPRLVSQTFQDGHTRDDFARYLYLLANVLEAEPVEYGQITVNEGYRGADSALPERTPPSRGF